MAMLNREILQKMAMGRLHDTKILLKEGRYDAAYYLAGYIVEYALKACFAKQTREFDFPERGKADKIFQHDLEQLVKVVGLPLADQCSLDKQLEAYWAIVVEWSERVRYDPLGVNDPAAMKSKAEAMVLAVEDGVLKWLQAHW